ncbi:hypothetical protein CEP53_013307 [Fusarium sp. AF-6]|nr:hypothetical protein CEP53_013307 [Fusarium sp. AF-6]
MTPPARKLAADFTIHLVDLSRHHHSNAKPVPEHGMAAAAVCGSCRCACRSLHEAVHTRRSKSEIALAAAEAALVAPPIPTPLGDSSLNGVSLTGRVQAMAQIGNRRMLLLRTAGWAWRDAVWRKTLLVAASTVKVFFFPFPFPLLPLRRLSNLLTLSILDTARLRPCCKLWFASFL